MTNKKKELEKNRSQKGNGNSYVYKNKKPKKPKEKYYKMENTSRVQMSMPVGPVTECEF